MKKINKVEQNYKTTFLRWDNHDINHFLKQLSKQLKFQLILNIEEVAACEKRFVLIRTLYKFHLLLSPPASPSPFSPFSFSHPSSTPLTLFFPSFYRNPSLLILISLCSPSPFTPPLCILLSPSPFHRPSLHPLSTPSPYLHLPPPSSPLPSPLSVVSIIVGEERGGIPPAYLAWFS